jgi:hypothetical protein
MTGIKAFLTVLLVMPLGHALTVLVLKLPPAGQYSVVIGGVIAATLIMFGTRYMRSAAWETFVGMITGVLLWASLVEIGVKLGAQASGVGENRAMEFSLAIIIPLFLYLLFNPNAQCNFFISLRKGLRIPHSDARPASTDNWGARTAFKMFTLIWMGHVSLFFAYDPEMFGTNGLFCKMFFISCLVGGIYLFYRLTKAQQMDFAFRYAIPTVIVIWSCIETLVKWKIFSEPWITLNPPFLTVIMLVFVGVLFLIVRAERKSKLSQ